MQDQKVNPKPTMDESSFGSEWMVTPSLFNINKFIVFI